MKTSRTLSGLLISASLLASPVSAFWPFPAKRFKANALISAGGLGLDGIQGRVVALGDLDGDQLSVLLCYREVLDPDYLPQSRSSGVE
jgi:hypothetical protein